jgi:hypothetical protein
MLNSFPFLVVLLITSRGTDPFDPKGRNGFILSSQFGWLLLQKHPQDWCHYFILFSSLQSTPPIVPPHEKYYVGEPSQHATL